MSDVIEALNIAIRLMERHLEAMTPGGIGRESDAYKMAYGRIETLKKHRDSLAIVDAA